MQNTTIEEVKNRALNFRGNLKSEIGFYDHSRIAKIPFRLESFVLTLNARISDHADSIILLYETDHVVPAFGLIRSNFESLSLLNRLNNAVSKSVENNILDESIDKDLETMALGTREKDYPVQATNILTQLKKMDKEWKGLMSIYESISEFVHPNHDGVVGSYSDFDYDNSKATIGNQYHITSNVSISALSFVNAQFKIAEHLTNSITGKMKSFAAICELDLKQDS